MYIMYVSVRECVQHVCAGACGSQRASDPPGTWVKSSCESSEVGAANEPLFAAESSFQLLFVLALKVEKNNLSILHL